MKRNEPEHDDIFNFGEEKTVAEATTFENETIQTEKPSVLKKTKVRALIVCAGVLAISIVVAMSTFSGNSTLASESKTLQSNNLPELLGPQSSWYSPVEQLQSVQTNLVCSNQDILCMTLQTNDPNKSLSDLSSVIQREKNSAQLYEIEVHVRKFQM